jgi:hypothetical protein
MTDEEWINKWLVDDDFDFLFDFLDGTVKPSSPSCACSPWAAVVASGTG